MSSRPPVGIKVKEKLYEYVDVHIASPYGVSGNLLIPAIRGGREILDAACPYRDGAKNQPTPAGEPLPEPIYPPALAPGADFLELPMPEEAAIDGPARAVPAPSTRSTMQADEAKPRVRASSTVHSTNHVGGKA